MARKRTTQDEFRVYVDYGCGFEEVCCEDTMVEAKERLMEYRQNDKAGFRFMVKKVRVPLGEVRD
jgi:hypothetical protein